MELAVDLDRSPSVNHERIEEAKRFIIQNYRDHATIRLRRRDDHNYFYCLCGQLWVIFHESIEDGGGVIVQQPRAIPIDELDDKYPSGLYHPATRKPVFSNFPRDAFCTSVYDRIEIDI